ncbi:MAG: 50S ribosomal protein L30 [Candidatus Eisenbacteria bacterium]
MSKQLKVRQIRSGINCLEGHKRTIRALGIRRMQQEVTLPDNAAIRGMVRFVRHLVTVEEIDG